VHVSVWALNFALCLVPVEHCRRGAARSSKEGGLNDFNASLERSTGPHGKQGISVAQRVRI
jgi:hypothetical protein